MVCRQRRISNSLLYFAWLKALSQLEQERSLLQEYLTAVEREKSAAVSEHLRLKKEMLTRQDQQSQHIDSLQSELNSAQQHLQHTKSAVY